MRGRYIPCACTIAGSDSSGGAGIQADLKTFTALGVWGCTVITAITAQNPREVRGTWALSPDAVALQLEAVQAEFSIGAFKTGMLPDAGIIERVAGILPASVPLVVDPVMISTSGYHLIDEEGRRVMAERLIPKATLVTPNIPEAMAITNMPSITSLEEMKAAGQAILDLGADAVLVKGGHLGGEMSVDVLVDTEGELALRGPRLPADVHGSGCCLASAIAAYLALGCSVREACRKAKSFIGHAIQEAVPGGSGMYMVNPAWALRSSHPD